MAVSTSKSTRSSVKNSVFGHPCKLSINQLPMKSDVFRCYLWYRDLCDSDTPGFTCQGKRDVLKLVASDVCGIWHSASIPTIREHSVV